MADTGAKAYRTYVMTKKSMALTLRIYSEYMNQIIMETDLSRTVPRDLCIWAGMDACIHRIELLYG